MAIEYTLDRQKEVVVSVFRREVTFEDIYRYALELREDPFFSEKWPALIDGRTMTSFLSASELRRLAGFVKTRPPEPPLPKRAIVVRNDALFGMIRMLEVFADGATVEYRAFRDLRAAWEWIGLPPPSDSEA
jgi:hypothetical protein